MTARSRNHASLAARTLTAALSIAFLAGGICAAAEAPVRRPATIAYTQVSGGVPHIWTINVDTRTRRRLTSGRYGEETPSWSPDGRRLIYTATRMHHVPGLAAPQIGPLIVIQDMATRTAQAITSGRDLDETPAWSPVGGRVAFVRTLIPTGNHTGPPEEIWTIAASGRGARQLTHNARSDIAPAWAPNGRRLVYQRARDGALHSWDLWTMHADGSAQRLLARNATRPAWSPDGRLIAFGQPTGQFRGCCQVTNLMLIDSTGTHRRLLVKNGGRPAWSPDGSRIVFQRMDGVRSALWIIDSDGSRLRRLTSGPGDAYAAAWRPH